jgi:putative transposase
MLERVADLTLEQLNEATQAWCEYEYNRRAHSETGQTPLARFLAGPTVMRDSPDSATLRLAFTRTDSRTQRVSDGTVVIDTRRFEAPNPYLSPSPSSAGALCKLGSDPSASNR